MTDLAAPVRYDPSVEDRQEDESKTVQQLDEQFDYILQTTAKDYGHAVRAVHAKPHGIIEGVLKVRDGLPPELAQGLFANPGEHKVLMRISTNPGDILDDSIGLPRGLAIKVHDVDGERLPGAAGRTQDFILVNGAVFTAKTADKFLGNLKMLAKTTDVAEDGKKMLSTVLRGVSAALGAVGLESATVNQLGGAPNSHPLGQCYWSQTPFRYGDHIAKFQLVPVSPDLVALKDAVVDASGRPDAIREDVRGSMRTANAVWELRVQLNRDLEKMPVEDPTQEWKEEQSPFQTVATITAQPQDSWDEDRVDEVNEHLRFSIWTGLAAHQPLGNINRARNEPYQRSADFRARVNGCPIHEPS